MDSIKPLYKLIFVASFGYFVDAFDLIIASLVRTESIIALGLASEFDQQSIKHIGIGLETWQSWGLLIGGLIFGILGDRFGRVRALYASIAIYSVSTLINGFLTPNWGDTYFVYCLLRFTAGAALAVEFGLAVTLVSEFMKKENRGYGSMAIAAFGLLGAVFAAILTAYTNLKWNELYIIGGVLGLMLLGIRMGTEESKVYSNQDKGTIAKGSFISLFTSKDRFKRFILCIGIALPTYLVIGLPMKFAPTFGKELGIDNVSLPLVIITFYIAMSISDIFANYISQRYKSRKRVFYFYNTASLVSILIFTFYPPSSAWQYQFIYSPMLGFSIGYWALIGTVSAESFGTNIRATVTSIVPNFIRATFIPIAALFVLLDEYFGASLSGGAIGVFCCVTALISTYFLKETFGKELNFEE